MVNNKFNEIETGVVNEHIAELGARMAAKASPQLVLSMADGLARYISGLLFSQGTSAYMQSAETTPLPPAAPTEIT